MIRTIGWQGRHVVVNSRVETGYTLPVDVPDAPPCSLRQLAVVPMGDGAGGTFYAEVRVRNITATTCSVRGRPDVELIDRFGRIFQSNGPDEGRQPTHDLLLAPNSWADVDLGGIASDNCGGDQTDRLRFRLPDQTSARTVSFAVGGPPDLRDCSIDEIRTFPHPGQLDTSAFRRVTKPWGDFAWVRALAKTLAVPKQVRPGQTLAFDVLLSNTDVDESGVGVDQASCPIFGVHLNGVATGGDYLLPCHPMVLLKAGASVDYQMRIRVPYGTPRGDSTLSWQLLEPSQRALTTKVHID